MGRIFKVEYDQNTDVPSYICDYCGTDIAKDRDRYMTVRFNRKLLILLEKADNLVVADEQHYQQKWNNIVADVNCVECNDLLGYKIIRRIEGRNTLIPGARVQTFSLFVGKLVLWDGEDVIAANYGL